MTTLTIGALEHLLESLGVETPLPPHAASDVLSRPLDIPRAYLARFLQSSVPDHADKAHGSIQVATSVDAGDLCVILPKLDRSCDAEDFAMDLMSQV